MTEQQTDMLIVAFSIMLVVLAIAIVGSEIWTLVPGVFGLILIGVAVSAITEVFK